MNATETKHRDICERTFQFAVRIIKLCQHLEEHSGVNRTLGNQLLRAGTSIGSNVEEAQAGHSRADFISKIGIALREARETHYWLRLLEAAEIVPASRIDSLKGEAEELKKILGAIVVSSRKRNPLTHLLFFIFTF